LNDKIPSTVCVSVSQHDLGKDVDSFSENFRRDLLTGQLRRFCWFWWSVLFIEFCCCEPNRS